MSIAARVPPPVMVPTRTARIVAVRGVSFVDRWLAFTCLVLLLTLIVALPSLMIASVPVRSVAASGLLVGLSILYPRAAAIAVGKSAPLLGLAAALAGIGIFVSLVNGTAPGLIAQSVLEMIVQSAIMIVVAFMLAELCGARACVIAIVGVVAVGGIIALFQALGVDAAWEIRRLLASVQAPALDDADPLDFGRRPLGLSYSTIQLATQLCLAFAVYTAVRDKERHISPGAPSADPAVIPALLALVAASVASGNRSPILGALIFFGVYAARRRGSWMPLVLMSAIFLALLAWPMFVSAVELEQLRVLRTTDQSAIGRWPLLSFGARLFLDNPLGYGFAFKPFDHWAAYWDELYTLPSAVVVQTRHLHNYVLNMLNTFGVGLMLLAPAVIALLRRSSASLVFFIPYVVHIMFHNSGPFWNDMIIWFVIAAISVAGNEQSRSGAGPATARARAQQGRRFVARRRRRREVDAAEW